MEARSKLDPEVVEAAILRRETLKVLGDPSNPTKISAEAATRNQKIVRRSLRTAGWAPFHKRRLPPEEGVAEPWRAHVLWHEDCRAVAGKLRGWFPDLRPTNKLQPMLSACGALVLVTWMPQFAHLEKKNPTQIMVDEEHLAATSAMVQNFLLLLTAHGMGTYWSSGGVFREELFFEKIGVKKKDAPFDERLLAAVFIEYPETLGEEKDRKPGNLRGARSEDGLWIQELSIGVE